MKKLFSIFLIVIMLSFCTVSISAETVDASVNSSTTTTTEETTPSLIPENIVEEPNAAIPAVEHVINFLFDGRITISQIVEYATIALMAIFSFAYNKYKRRLLKREKAISKTDIEIAELKSKDEDMANQLGLLGNMIVCAYLSNNLVDPEVKKKLAAYAEELMKNTTIDQDKLTEKLILAAQNPNFKEKVNDLKDGINQEAAENQKVIDNMKDDIETLALAINQEGTTQMQASDVIDTLRIGGTYE